ncbi:MAG: hypothetical protein OEM52_02950 [bacterium]|nr:hypothetical protein [bacterium]
MNLRSTTVPPPIEGGRFTPVKMWSSLAIASIILILFILVQPSPITNVDSGLKWYGAKIYAETSELSLPESDSTWLNQFQFPPVPKPYLYPVNGSIYPVFPAVPMVLNGLVYRWWGENFWWFWTLLATMSLLGLLLWYTKPFLFNPHLLLLVLLFATPVAVYGATYWEHSLAAFVGCAGVVYLRSSRHLVTLLGGLLLGFAPWFRPEMVAWSLLAIIAGWVFLANRQRLWGTTGLITGLLIGTWIQHQLTGTWLPLQVLSNYETGETVLTPGSNVRFPILIYLELVLGAGDWWITIVAVLMVIVGMIGWRLGKWYSVFLPATLLLFLITRMLDPLPVFHTIQANGLIYTLPLLLIAPWGVRKLPNHYIWIAAIAGLLISIVAMGKVAQGMHWGMRFFLPAAFPLTIAAIQALREKPLSKFSAWLSAVGVLAITFYGVFWHSGIASRQIQFADVVRQQPELIATDVSWIGGDLAPLLSERPISFIRDREKMGRYLLTLKSRNITTFQYVRSNSSDPLTQMAPNLEKLIALRRVVAAPTPEKGYDYRLEFYNLIGDTILFGSLAGELGALQFLKEDSTGLEDVRLALRWNPDDSRPAIALLVFGIEHRTGRWIDEALRYFDVHPVPQQFEAMVAEAKRFRVYMP